MFSPTRYMRRATVLTLSVMAMLAAPSFVSASAKVEQPATAEKKVEVTAAPPVDYKEAFLQFALDKAKLYSGKAEDAIGKGIDLAQQEAPDLARQFLTWRAWRHALIFSIGPVLLLVFGTSAFLSLHLGNKLAEKKNKERGVTGYTWDDSGVHLFGLVASAIVAVIGFFTAIGNFDHLLSFIQIQVAPKIYLAEQLLALVKR